MLSSKWWKRIWVADWHLLMTIDDEETFLGKATDIMEKKAKEIAKNLLEIGLTKDSVALTA